MLGKPSSDEESRGPPGSAPAVSLAACCCCCSFSTACAVLVAVASWLAFRPARLAGPLPPLLLSVLGGGPVEPTWPASCGFTALPAGTTGSRPVGRMMPDSAAGAAAASVPLESSSWAATGRSREAASSSNSSASVPHAPSSACGLLDATAVTAMVPRRGQIVIEAQIGPMLLFPRGRTAAVAATKHARAEGCNRLEATEYCQMNE